MGIRNAGIIIKEARLKAGLTQEQLSFGICTLNSLSFIENSRCGVSSSTFQALMAKAGSPCEAYPIFRDKKEFDAFICLKNARLYADNRCLSLAYAEIKNLVEAGFGYNRHYYQETMYLYCLTMYLTYTADYNHLLDVLLKAVRVTLTDFNPDSCDHQYFSSVEFEIINLMANIYLNIGEKAKAFGICGKLNSFLTNSINKDRYNAYLETLLGFTFSKYYFLSDDAEKAKEHSSRARALSLDYFIYPFKLEIFMLDKIADFMLGQSSVGRDFTYACALAAHLECGFLPLLSNVLKEIGFPKEYIPKNIPARYEFDKIDFDINSEDMSGDSFEIGDEGVLTIGSLIGLLRKNQSVPLRKLCEGLCSVSKLSKIESGSQAPSVYLAETLLNRLGYSDRDFLFYGNDKETEYSHSKNVLISQNMQGKLSSAEIDREIKLCMGSSEPIINQLGLLFDNIKDPTSADERKRLWDALNITLPGFNADDLNSHRLTWAEISILNNIVINCIRSNDLAEASKINDQLYEYSKSGYIKPGFKNITLIASAKNRMRILYNKGEYLQVIEQYYSMYDEFVIKNFNLAGDLFFYSSQSFGELKEFERLKTHAEIAAGYFTLMGNSKRCNYLVSEIKRDFGIEI